VGRSFADTGAPPGEPGSTPAQKYMHHLCFWPEDLLFLTWEAAFPAPLIYMALSSIRETESYPRIPGCVTFLQPGPLFDIVRACSLVVRLGGVVARHPPPASGQMGEDELAL